VLWSAQGQSNTQIAGRLHWSNATVGKWRQRFIEHWLATTCNTLRPFLLLPGSTKWHAGSVSSPARHSPGGGCQCAGPSAENRCNCRALQSVQSPLLSGPLPLIRSYKRSHDLVRVFPGCDTSVSRKHASRQRRSGVHLRNQETGPKWATAIVLVASRRDANRSPALWNAFRVRG
jgi:hypothetical protein